MRCCKCPTAREGSVPLLAAPSNNSFWIWGVAVVVYVLPKLRIQASCRLTSSWDTLGLIRRIACRETL